MKRTQLRIFQIIAYSPAKKAKSSPATTWPSSELMKETNGKHAVKYNNTVALRTRQLLRRDVTGLRPGLHPAVPSCTRSYMHGECRLYENYLKLRVYLSAGMMWVGIHLTSISQSYKSSHNSTCRANKFRLRQLLRPLRTQ